jgi:hypothetical protein
MHKTDAAGLVLFGDSYAPVTSSIGIVRASLQEVAEELRQWRAEIHGAATVRPLDGGLLENVMRLEPLTGGVRPRELLVATQHKDWTALFDCGVQGGDQVTTVAVLARRMVVQGLAVTSILDRRAGNGLRSMMISILGRPCWYPILRLFRRQACR